MSEKEIRRELNKFCAELDLRARAAATHRACLAVVPLVVGAGLAVSACDDETDTTQTGSTASGTTSGTTTGTGAGTQSTGTPSGTPAGTGGMGGTAGGGGDVGGAGGEAGVGGATGGGGAGIGGVMLYMAPDA